MSWLYHTLICYWFFKGKKKIFQFYLYLFIYLNGILLLIITQIDTACGKSLLFSDKNVVDDIISQSVSQSEAIQKTNTITYSGLGDLYILISHMI